ncbi:TATA-box binding protein associated factor 7 [Dermatophagoides pteronyssinus]|uniref:Transcription initiation factor TFIID subunit 7 n=1 Tax=Dermatophagoides pteronyssinus TaxID=6956 RepID=A0ABQ8JQ99_DERPT|nr:transcription initiation factor TFIID subunit 7 [Dermatophagoides pteronyssinus]
MPLEEQPKLDSTNDNFELESQFILRLPSLPAASLRAAIKSGVLNLKDRLSIQIDQDIRNGIVRFDGWVLPAKIVDLPTILESLKTLDNKNFYKTADISQMMICKEETDEIVKEDPDEVVKKTKDGRDKKYLYPHGITKPLKNVRKRRFRKTLRKKYVDFPEIEKEVKRLLRQDNEATNVRFEIVNIEEENKADPKEKDQSSSTAAANATNSALDDRDLFGDVVSSSDDDDDERLGYSDEGSRMSGTFRDYLRDHNVDNNDNDTKIDSDNNNKNLSFSQAFSQQQQSSSSTNVYDYSTSAAAADAACEENNEASYSLTKNLENESIRLKLQELEQEIFNLQTQRHQQQTDLDSIENMALKQRFQSIIDDLREQELAKKQEYDELKKSLF